MTPSAKTSKAMAAYLTKLRCVEPLRSSYIIMETNKQQPSVNLGEEEERGDRFEIGKSNS